MSRTGRDRYYPGVGAAKPISTGISSTFALFNSQTTLDRDADERAVVAEIRTRIEHHTHRSHPGEWSDRAESCFRRRPDGDDGE